MIPYSMDYLRRHLRVCIYARVSTEHEAQLSALENQLDWYKPLLELHPEWTLVDQYIDEGITGTSAEKREDFMRMIEDANPRSIRIPWKCTTPPLHAPSFQLWHYYSNKRPVG